MPERTWSAWHHVRCNEMARSGEQEMVEAFAAQSADPVFRDRVRVRARTEVPMRRMQLRRLRSSASSAQ